MPLQDMGWKLIDEREEKKVKRGERFVFVFYFNDLF